ncbi:MAG: 50S ribosomal protein L18 [Deltaproteobacteria bacterium]|nr:50S ribosomal protein L18 [Deltaproteobacteria bacterium]
MGKTKKIKKIREKRKKRVRGKISGTSDYPRIAVFRSTSHIYAQAVDDDAGQTVASASTLSKELKGKLGGMKKTQVAAEVGKLLAKRLKDKNIQKAVFDRGAFLYHGRVKALAEAAKEAGLKI